ncbi:MAG: hypothetical protein HRF49_11065 [bacterium]|jgi:hypothetical protein
MSVAREVRRDGGQGAWIAFGIIVLAVLGYFGYKSLMQRPGPEVILVANGRMPLKGMKVKITESNVVSDRLNVAYSVSQNGVVKPIFAWRTEQNWPTYQIWPTAGQPWCVFPLTYFDPQTQNNKSAFFRMDPPKFAPYRIQDSEAIAEDYVGTKPPTLFFGTIQHIVPNELSGYDVMDFQGVYGPFLEKSKTDFSPSNSLYHMYNEELKWYSYIKYSNFSEDFADYYEIRQDPSKMQMAYMGVMLRHDGQNTTGLIHFMSRDLGGGYKFRLTDAIVNYNKALKKAEILWYSDPDVNRKAGTMKMLQLRQAFKLENGKLLMAGEYGTWGSPSSLVAGSRKWQLVEMDLVGVRPKPKVIWEQPAEKGKYIASTIAVQWVPKGCDPVITFTTYDPNTKKPKQGQPDWLARFKMDESKLGRVSAEGVDVQSVFWGRSGKYLWYLGHDKENKSSLYRWDPATGENKLIILLDDEE